MKFFVIRWALRKLRKAIDNNPNLSFYGLEKFGVEDIITLSNGERAILIGLRPQAIGYGSKQNHPVNEAVGEEK